MPVTKSHNSDNNTAIWWIRRDLRLSDNQALNAALKYAHQVYPVFILDDNLLRSKYTAEKRLSFLFNGLHKLDGDLRSRGSRLIIKNGRPEAILAQMMHEVGAETVYAEADHSPYA